MKSFRKAVYSMNIEITRRENWFKFLKERHRIPPRMVQHVAACPEKWDLIIKMHENTPGWSVVSFYHLNAIYNSGVKDEEE